MLIVVLRRTVSSRETGWQSSALVSSTKILSRDVAPTGDDIEPVGESRADVGMGYEEDEELLEAEIPRVSKNPKNPTSLGVLLVSKVEVLVDNIELNYWKKRKEKGRLQS